MQFTLVDPTNKCKVATSQMTRLLGSIVDKKTIHVEYVVVTLEEIFIHETIEPFVH
jgi:hypothetical protein